MNEEFSQQIINYSCLPIELSSLYLCRSQWYSNCSFWWSNRPLLGPLSAALSVLHMQTTAKWILSTFQPIKIHLKCSWWRSKPGDCVENFRAGRQKNKLCGTQLGAAQPGFGGGWGGRGGGGNGRGRGASHRKSLIFSCCQNQRWHSEHYLQRHKKGKRVG